MKTRDLVDNPDPEIRKEVMTLYCNVIHGQSMHLEVMRAHFFKVVDDVAKRLKSDSEQKKRTREDLADEVELVVLYLEALTGQKITYFIYYILKY